MYKRYITQLRLRTIVALLLKLILIKQKTFFIKKETNVLILVFIKNTFKFYLVSLITRNIY